MAGKIAHIWEALSACFDANDEPLTKSQVLAWIGTHYAAENFNPATVQAQLYRSCANVPFAQAYKTPKILFYNQKGRTYCRNESVVGDETDSSFEPPQLTSEETSASVILEAHLQAYLARNLPKLEKGLALWSDTPPSVEYYLDGRRIDILAKDSNGIPVVIEVKRDIGYDKVVGQALLYQALIAAKLKVSRVRIILVANEISFELKMACSKLVDVELFEYELEMKIGKVTSQISEEEA